MFLIDSLIMNTGFLWSKVFLSDDPWLQITDIASFYNIYLPWRFEPDVYTTTFEKLIGKQGGGSEDEQIKEIIAIGNHLGKPLTWNKQKKLPTNYLGVHGDFVKGRLVHGKNIS